jgi:hypothetical protein
MALYRSGIYADGETIQEPQFLAFKPLDHISHHPVKVPNF